MAILKQSKRFIASMIFSFPLFIKGSQPIAPDIAPAMHTPVIIESNFVYSLSSQPYINLNEGEMLPQDAIPKPKRAQEK